MIYNHLQPLLLVNSVYMSSLFKLHCSYSHQQIDNDALLDYMYVSQVSYKPGNCLRNDR
jgi:hypothetical protein